MSKPFLLLILLLISTVVTSAFLVEKWVISPSTPSIELNQSQLKKLLSNCNDKETNCSILNASAVNTENIHFSAELKRSISENGMMLLSNEQQQMLLLKNQGQYYNIVLPADLMALETRNDYTALAFYLLNTLLFLAVMLPLFITLHRLNRQAQKVSETGYPEPIRLSYPTFLSPMIDSFNSMVNKLHHTMDLQKELSATVCHEMRTPLSKMGFINAMIDDVPIANTQQQLAKISNEMQELVDDYLNFSKHELQNNQIILHQQPIYALLQSFCDQYQEHLTVQFTLDCPLLQHATFNERTFKRAINNLLSNAAKYAKNNIAISFIEQPSTYVLIVEDDGIGLDDTKTLSQPYQQGQQAVSGYGLGLAIVRRVMDWHHGHITLARSIQLGGAKIRLSWPKQT